MALKMLQRLTATEMLFTSAPSFPLTSEAADERPKKICNDFVILRFCKLKVSQLL